MLRSLRSDALLTSLAAGAVLTVPGTAYAADTTTQLSAAGMTAALKKVSTTSTAAAEKGWRATMSTAAGKQALTGTYIVDPVAKVVSEQIRVGNRRLINHAVEGKGLYMYVDDAKSRAAVKMVGRPSVRYAFMAKAVKLDTYIAQNTPSPTAVLTEDVDHAGTRTTHDDGSTDYRYTADKGVTVAVHVDRAGTLASVRGASAETQLRLAYRYGAQHVTLPAASVTIDWATLRRALAYLSMPATVKKAALQGAANTRRAAAGTNVKISSLRTIVRHDTAAIASASRVSMQVGNIRGGVRVAASNPWTHQKVSYTVTASGRKVLVKQS